MAVKKVQVSKGKWVDVDIPDKNKSIPATNYNDPSMGNYAGRTGMGTVGQTTAPSSFNSLQTNQAPKGVIDYSQPGSVAPPGFTPNQTSEPKNEYGGLTPEQMQQIEALTQQGEQVARGKAAETLDVNVPKYGTQEYFDNIRNQYTAGAAPELARGAERTRNLLAGKGIMQSSALPSIYSREVEQPYQAGLQKLMGQEVTGASQYFSKDKPQQDFQNNLDLLPYITQGYVESNNGASPFSGYNINTEQQLTEEQQGEMATNLGFSNLYEMAAYAQANPEEFARKMEEYHKGKETAGKTYSKDETGLTSELFDMQQKYPGLDINRFNTLKQQYPHLSNDQIVNAMNAAKLPTLM